MSPDVSEDSATLSPDEAFAVLGNEMRLRILQTLGEAGEPLSFTELRNRIGSRQGGNFNYHLDKLVGHFVRKTDDGYELRQAGRSIIEAVLSGAITDDPVLEPTEIDFTCRLCGAPVKVSFRRERVQLYCTECAGQYDGEITTRESMFPGDHGFLGGYHLPPAGIKGRTADEVMRAASTWTHLELLAMANDICPRCSAVVDHEIEVCEDHDATEDLCERCGQRYAVKIIGRCTNCPYETNGMFGNYVWGKLELRVFVGDHGMDPIVEGVKWGWDYSEEVLSVDPFKARLTYTIDNEMITLTVDDELDVVDATTVQVSDDD